MKMVASNSGTVAGKGRQRAPYAWGTSAVLRSMAVGETKVLDCTPEAFPNLRSVAAKISREFGVVYETAALRSLPNKVIIIRTI